MLLDVLVSRWAVEHPGPVGLVEAAAGAALLAWGVTNGAIEMGAQLVGLEPSMPIGVVGGPAGGLSGLALGLLGNIGVVAGGGGFGVPALLLSGGGAIVLGLAGYGFDGALHRAIDTFDWTQAVLPGSALVVGVTLLGRGLARIAGVTLNWLDAIGAIPIIEAVVTARTREELPRFDPAYFASVGGGAMLGGVGGATIGASLAAGSVTVIGSHSLGAAALALGLVSAPVWPVVVAALAGGLLTAGAVVSVRARHSGARQSP